VDKLCTNDMYCRQRQVRLDLAPCPENRNLNPCNGTAESYAEMAYATTIVKRSNWTVRRIDLLLRLLRLLLIVGCWLIHAALSARVRITVRTRGGPAATPARPDPMDNNSEMVGERGRQVRRTRPCLAARPMLLARRSAAC
jgi:hypothetical protein